MKVLNWGIMGAGNIAVKLADALALNANSKLVSISSKSMERAAKFAENYNIKAFDNYQTMFDDSELDVIYVATTHNFHYENAKMALENNKSVLVEKPFTVNAQQASELVALAREKELFLMEAIWTRYLPSIIHLKSLLNAGVIGEVKLFDISFCNIAPSKYLPRLMDPKLAGGVTLDMGIYPITFVNYLMDELPVNVNSQARLGETGVDEMATYQLQFANKAVANINTSMNVLTQNRSMIYGETGYIEFPYFQQGSSFTIHTHDHTNVISKSETIHVENHENGFIYQVEEVVKCISEGKLESDIMPLNETVNTMKMMDNMRKEWGLVYPGEE